MTGRSEPQVSTCCYFSVLIPLGNRNEDVGKTASSMLASYCTWRQVQMLSLLGMYLQVLKRRYGKEADIWSCGVILYILLSGVPPFWGETEQQIFDAVAKGHIDFKTDPWPNVSSEAKDAVCMMLQQVSPCMLTP